MVSNFFLCFIRASNNSGRCQQIVNQKKISPEYTLRHVELVSAPELTMVACFQYFRRSSLFEAKTCPSSGVVKGREIFGNEKIWNSNICDLSAGIFDQPFPPNSSSIFSLSCVTASLFCSFSFTKSFTFNLALCLYFISFI